LTDIGILKNYIHLRYMDLSNNNLKDITPLNLLTHLLTLKLDFNKLTSAKLDPLPYLQHASFSNNRIKSTEGIAHPKLEILNLNSSFSSFFS
jgi:Leucine-rich repeat (LRR) protein